MLAIAFTTAIRRLVSQAGDSAARNAFQLSEVSQRVKPILEHLLCVCAVGRIGCPSTSWRA